MSKLSKIAKMVLPEKAVEKFVDWAFDLAPMKWSNEKLEEELSKRYQAIYGKTIDFNNPKSFSEKIQWYKIYYDNPNLSRIVCKYNFKKYVAEKLGSEDYTIPLYGAWKRVKDIDWELLPNTFVLKSNCQSDGNCIKIVKDKQSINIPELKKELETWLLPKNTLINSLCKAYWSVTPMIIAEEYVEQVNNQLYDYKFFCFNGEPYCIYVATEHFDSAGNKGNSVISFYDLNWNLMDVTYGKHKRGDVEKPIHFDEMIKLSKKLSKNFPFVRVDFFETDTKFYVAELTFYPGGGYTSYKPEFFDYELGRQFIIPTKNNNEFLEEK